MKDPHSITPIRNLEQNNSHVTPCDSLERGKLLNKPQPTRQPFRAAPLDTYSPCSYYVLAVGGDCQQRRSEEHTSELQSLMRISYAVFCLKNKNKYKTLSHVLLHDHNISY